MTREEFDFLPSGGQINCPDCGSKDTHPYPGCDCRSLTTGKKLGDDIMPRGFHINKYHHECPTRSQVEFDEGIGGEHNYEN